MEYRLILFHVFLARYVIEGSYENSIIMTSIPDSPGLPGTHHVYMIPGTPYDLARNSSLYGIAYTLTKSSQLSAKITSCSMDYSRKIFYFYDYTAARLETIPHFDWENSFSEVTAVTRIHTGVSRGYVKVKVDWVSHNVYWTDPLFRWIAMQQGGAFITDTSLYTILVKEELDKPYALAVDPIGRFIFWSDISDYPKIERASLTGQNREVIISKGLAFPVAIDVDVSGTSRRIYWVDTVRDTVESALLDGEDRRIVRRMAHTEFFDLALYRDVLSVVDVAGEEVQFINKLNGELVANPYRRTNEVIWGICMYHAEVQPEMEDFCATANCSDLCVNEDGKASCLCKEGFKLKDDGLTCEVDTSTFHRSLVFTDGAAIYQADIRSVTAVLSAYPLKTIDVSAAGYTGLRYLTMDVADRIVFFTTNDLEIHSFNIDMLNPIVDHVVSSTSTITSLSLDWLDKTVYWTTSDGTVSVVTQTGGSEFTFNMNLDNPTGLRVLPLEKKMVWISGTTYSKRIEISDLIGDERLTVVEGLTDPKSLEFDSHTNRIYWVDNGYIKSSTINGSDIKNIPVQSTSPNLLSIYMDYLIWTEDMSTTSTTVRSVSIRKPSENIIADTFSNVGAIKSIMVLDERVQPWQKGPCETDNGGCEHICISVGRHRQCECEYGFTKDSNGQTCSSVPFEDNALIVTDWTHNKIYFVSLVSDETRAFDIESGGNPNAVVYNPVEKTVIWADTKDNMIHSSFLNGSNHRIIINEAVSGTYADRLVVDSTSGNLYYTRASAVGGSVGVSVISPRGDNKVLIDGGYIPRDIVLDPGEGLMFWTDHGTTPSVKRANMDGTSVAEIITDTNTIKWPNGIAIDYTEKQLYISDGSLNTIQRCSYSGQCTVITTDIGAHLMDIELYGQYLYYTAWNRPYITKIRKDSPSIVTRLATNAEFGRLDSISVYILSAEAQPENTDCLLNDGLGDCSTLCLPTQNGHTCACQTGVSLRTDGKTCYDIPLCPENIPNGEITGTCTFLQRAECAYNCDRFYIATTSNNRVTCIEGMWDEQTPCVFSTAKCTDAVDQVLFDTACNHSNGETCTYSCVHGYSPTVPDKTMTCDDGSWDVNSPCAEIVPDCSTEADKVRFDTSCLYQNWEICSYTCTSGYQPSTTSNTLTCIDGHWNNPEPCEKVPDCPVNINNTLFVQPCTYQNEETCNYVCNDGYQPTTDDSSMNCVDTFWIPETPCAKIPDCPYIEQVEFATTCSYQNGETCTFLCAVGYSTLTSSNTLTCNGGNWSTQTPCVKDCSKQVERVLFLAGCTFHSGEKCSYSCTSGYEPTSSDSTIECNEGVWNIEKPCAQDCPAVVGAVIFDNACSYHSDEMCSYTCITGYKPTATNSSMKCHDGAWSIQKPCREIPDCPSTIPNGEIIDSCTFFDGAECAYTCNSFYTATQPSSRITCVEGRWSEQTPCSFSTVKCPEKVDKVLFGRACNHNNGETCTYRCDHGYTPTAPDDNMTCDDGSWDVESPCDEIDPVCSSAVENVLFDAACLYQNDETCTFRCLNGATLTTSDSSMTCRGGHWTIQTPCAFITTTTTTITSRHTSSKSSSPTQSQGVPPGITDTVSIVPIAVGAGVAGFILIIIVIVLLLVIYIRSRKQVDGAEHHEFESPVYQGFVDQDLPDYTTLEGVSQRPDTTYDLINLHTDDKVEYNGESCNRVGNDYTQMRSVMAPSGEYETLHRETSDYLEPTASIKGNLSFI